LYAENVLLKGSLTTGYSDNIRETAPFSGLGTDLSSSFQPNSSSNYFKNPAKILFWAGAKLPDLGGDDEEERVKQAISSSPFYVDANGNMYAGSGYFEGSIISKATIEAATMKTAELIGTGTEDAALKIRDAKTGIAFCQGDKEVFSLKNDSIEAKVHSIIFNENFKIDKEGILSIPTLSISSYDKNNIDIINSFVLDASTHQIGFSQEGGSSNLSHIDFNNEHQGHLGLYT
jgi:hypothetical protein